MEDKAEVFFVINHSDEHVRLLELPPDLLELLTSEQPSSQESLQLKSSTSDIPDGGVQTDQNAVLCTANSTYQIRQVQSSNSVFIIQPSGPSDVEEDQPTAVMVSAIAQCPTTLELVPSPDNGVSRLAQALPISNGTSNDHHGDGREVVARGKESYVADIATSVGELESAWVEICAFELEGQAWRPSEKLLLALWGSILTNATANGLDFGKRILKEELVAFAREDGYQEALLQAMLWRIQSDGTEVRSEWTAIDRERCVRWVGALVLHSLTSDGGVSEASLLAEWQNRLPEPWIQSASLRILKDEYTTTDSGLLLSKTSYTPNRVSTSNSTTGRKMGKWHERFKSARN